MKWSQTLIHTLREDPKDAESASHRLMLRAGLIRKLSSGVYSYLPLGFRVLEKVVKIIREEMARAGASELLLPALHPAELWKKTGRYEALGEDKIAFKNRSGQEFVLGPTHEEVITDLVASSVQSYKDLPLLLYQIQTKFRDEPRPRFGVIRSKEFIMKDAYSFDRSWEGLDQSYERMFQAYQRIFERCGLPIEIVNADPGLMGGDVSHEFMFPCDFGEDIIAKCSGCGLTASRNIAARGVKPGEKSQIGKAKLESFSTPGLKSVGDLTTHFHLEAGNLLKTLLFKADGKPVAALVRGDEEAHEGKLRRYLQAKELVPASPAEIEAWTGAPCGFSGPVGLSGVRLIGDYDLFEMADFVTGANQKDFHLRGVNLGRDFECQEMADIRTVREGDLCAGCLKPYCLKRALEMAHIFKLGTRYSKPLGAVFLDESGKTQEMIMGCYGIGVNRIIAASIENSEDKDGIVWPLSIAPFDVHLLVVNQEDSESAKEAEILYGQLWEEGVEVLYDDRPERAGVKFKDADLIGIPIQLIVSERNLKRGKIELLVRRGKERHEMEREKAIRGIKLLLATLDVRV